jgi:hypothetical protein
VVSVVAAVGRELEPLPDVLRDGALAAAALALAEKIDRRVSWADVKELRESMAALRALAPPGEEADEVDEVAARRRARRAARSAAAAD